MTANAAMSTQIALGPNETRAPASASPPSAPLSSKPRGSARQGVIRLLHFVRQGRLRQAGTTIVRKEDTKVSPSLAVRIAVYVPGLMEAEAATVTLMLESPPKGGVKEVEAEVNDRLVGAELNDSESA